MTGSSTSIKEKEFKTDLGSLIRILGDHLYAEADVFVRELIQNAHDSIRRRGEGVKGVIRIVADRGQGTVVVTDNGVGMSEADIEQYLATIGGSGTRTTRDELLRGGVEGARGLIGQFGIGLLSAFIVAREVIVETRSAAEATGFRWTAVGGPNYQMALIDRSEIGSTVTLILKEKYLGMSRAEVLKEAVRKYCDFLPYPIFVNGIHANTMTPPWRRHYGSEEERKQALEAWVRDRFSDVPLEIIPVNLDEPRVEGVLYISDGRVPDLNTAGVVDVYQAHMFVRSKDPDLLPPWAKFVAGVLDSEALTITAGRDAVRKDEQHTRVREALARLIVDALCDLATAEPHRFRLLVQWHHYHIKGMALKHDDFFDIIADQVPFEVNRTAPDTEDAHLVSLPEYCTQQNATDAQGRTIIYYISEKGDAAQFQRLCEASGLLVISAGLLFEESFLKKYADRHADSVTLHCVDRADSEALFTPLHPSERTAYLDLEHRLGRLMEEVVPEQEVIVQAEHFLPVDTPAVLTHWRDSETRRRLATMAEHPAFSEAFADLFTTVLGPQGTERHAMVLHLNANCDLVQRLKAEPFTHPAVQTMWQLICHNALLYGPQALDATRIARLQAISYETVQHMVALFKRLHRLEKDSTGTWLSGLGSRAPHTRLLALLPEDDESPVLEQALRLLFEDAPFWFELVTVRNDACTDDTLAELMRVASSASGFVVGVTGLNLDGLMQLSALMAIRGDRPWISLVQEGEPVPSALLQDDSCVPWARVQPREPAAALSLADQLRSTLAGHDALRELREGRALRFLSETFLRRVMDASLLRPEAADKLRGSFASLEEVLEADLATIMEKAYLDEREAANVKSVLEHQEWRPDDG